MGRAILQPQSLDVLSCILCYFTADLSLVCFHTSLPLSSLQPGFQNETLSTHTPLLLVSARGMV